nr:hypothetical protein BaRGS_010715 [Batillaria attramentaria]
MMTLIRLAVLLLTLASGGHCTTEDRVDNLEEISRLLARQSMKQQLYMEDRTRSDGDSGLKLSYNTATHASWSIAALHDHPEFERMLGMGEIIAVLNGVEFQTRHNDYNLVRPSTISGEYHKVEDIPYPPVPPEVTSLPTVEEQVVEMQEWFKAWRDSNHTNRDYRRYFRPNLCYLEGAWTTDVDTISEPFDSIRHQLDADTYDEMFDKVRFMAYTGDKNLLENLAQLPSIIINVTDGVPVRAQWNYRILCHPIEGNVNMTELELVDDLGKRLTQTKDIEKYRDSRAARFALSPSSVTDFTSKLDQIMSQIPGKNNYGTTIIDETLTRPKLDPSDDSPRNVANYHRWFKLAEKGAMGDNTVHRGYNDRNEANAECEIVEKRVSYAIPLEIVFMTPLHAWNPYNLEHKGYYKSDLGQTVAEGDRNGQATENEAYNGINDRYFYLTPLEFFTSGNSLDADSADTTRKSVGVLGPDGVVREVAASGTRIFLPEITGVGSMRLRYPIMPLYIEGSSIWKELEALRDVVLDMQQYMKYFYT